MHILKHPIIKKLGTAFEMHLKAAIKVKECPGKFIRQLKIMVLSVI